MTVEELKELAKLECAKLLKSEKGYSGLSFQEFWEEGYKKGLAEGKPKWHNLREDPHDLPKDNDKKLCFYKKGKVIARYDSEYNCWETCFNNLETIIPLSVITAWCELPKFEE